MREELSYVESYLAIEQARYRDKLTVNYYIEPTVDLNVTLPPFTIQPLVENAIKHGLKPKLEGGEILINILDDEDSTVISVEDNGIGINTHPNRMPDKKDSGLGLYLVNERLKKFYGEESMLHIESYPNLGTKVTFKIPKKSILKDVVFSHSS